MNYQQSNSEPALSRQLLDILHGSWMTQALHAACALRIPDHLHAGAHAPEAIARASDAYEPSVHRLLRALCAIGACREEPDGAFHLTDLGQLLRDDHPQSLRAWVLWWSEHLWTLWGELDESVRSGQSARARLTGTQGFAHLERDPAAAATFNRALAQLTQLTVATVTAAFDFRPFRTIVDVGGGHGQLLAAILHAAPSARGVLFDLPHALQGARDLMLRESIAHRCDVVAGDFFEAVPPAADAYVIKSVLHDWNDDRCVSILRTCREAMTPVSRLLIVEQVLPDVFRDDPIHRSLARSDLTMLIAHGAGERTQAQFRALLDRAGLAALRLIPAGITFSVIECVPARP
ncbi:MAG: methyltransferase [Phycisphaeraceae bacterium]|nr:methyltransferase [Phycisphaeraceae bacterium]